VVLVAPVVSVALAVPEIPVDGLVACDVVDPVAVELAV
jgi:hypothetical protein